MMKIVETCPECGKLFLSPKFTLPTFEHIIFSVCTVGFWLPVWLFISWKQHVKADCVECGEERSFLSLINMFG
jgi:hypothetical protein